MENFNAFRQNLNRRPENARSSMIESQPQYNDPTHSDSQFNNPWMRSDQQNISEEPPNRYYQNAPSIRNYNYSGKPLNLSDFQNDMTSETHFNNNSTSRNNEPSVSRYSQRNSSHFHDVPRHQQIERSDNSLAMPNFYQEHDVHRNKDYQIPYEDSGRTFNLTEFAANNSNNAQQTDYDNGISARTLNISNKQSNRSCTANASGKPLQHDPCEYFSKTLCPDFFQTSQCQQKASNGTPRRLPECQFEENSQSKLLSQPVTKKNPFFETLVKDSYFPGIIVDAVNGLVDFNKVAFGSVFDCEHIPSEINHEAVPMSLLEAFDLRIKYEKDLRDDLERRKFFCSEEFKKEQSNVTPENKDAEGTSEKVTYWTHRDELKLASTIDIDLMSKVSKFPETPLTEAIYCLLKAEKMNNFDRNVHLAEEAIGTASDGQQELAALKSTCSFKLDLQKDEIKTTNTYEPLAIVSYIGITKPNNE